MGFVRDTNGTLTRFAYKRLLSPSSTITYPLNTARLLLLVVKVDVKSFCCNIRCLKQHVVASGGASLAKLILPCLLALVTNFCQFVKERLSRSLLFLFLSFGCAALLVVTLRELWV